MSHQDIIEKLWDQRDQINFIEDNEAKKNVEIVLNLSLIHISEPTRQAELS